jgi:hypothetical protein
MRASQDSMYAKQDSAWAALDRTLRVHSDTAKAPDTAHTMPVVPPVDTAYHAPPDSTLPTPPDTSGAGGR